MKFSEFFNPKDIKHIEAYLYLNEHGYLPDGFVPKECKMDNNWQMAIMAKMALAYANMMAKTQSEKE